MNYRIQRKSIEKMMNMTNEEEKYPITDEMVQQAVDKVKKAEIVNKIFGYKLDATQMADQVNGILDEIVRPK